MAKRILIADDTAFMRMLLSDVLTKNGYQIVGEAEDGAEGVEKYMELKPDLVLMDIVMPGMDGLEALKAIKEKDPAAVVVMCSRMGQEVMVKGAMAAGADGFIVKPFDADTLLGHVKDALKQAD